MKLDVDPSASPFELLRLILVSGGLKAETKLLPKKKSINRKDAFVAYKCLPLKTRVHPGDFGGPDGARAIGGSVRLSFNDVRV